MAKKDVVTGTGSKRGSRPVTEAAPPAAGLAGHRVVVFLQENKTTDFYFPTLAAWGAAVANQGGLLARRRISTSRMTATRGCTTRWATTRRCPCRSTTTR